MVVHHTFLEHAQGIVCGIRRTLEFLQAHLLALGESFSVFLVFLFAKGIETCLSLICDKLRKLVLVIGHFHFSLCKLLSPLFILAEFSHTQRIRKLLIGGELSVLLVYLEALLQLDHLHLSPLLCARHIGLASSHGQVHLHRPVLVFLLHLRAKLLFADFGQLRSCCTLLPPSLLEALLRVQVQRLDTPLLLVLEGCPLVFKGRALGIFCLRVQACHHIVHLSSELPRHFHQGAVDTPLAEEFVEPVAAPAVETLEDPKSIQLTALRARHTPELLCEVKRLFLGRGRGGVLLADLVAKILGLRDTSGVKFLEGLVHGLALLSMNLGIVLDFLSQPGHIFASLLQLFQHTFAGALRVLQVELLGT